jgi:hypothetical protein
MGLINLSIMRPLTKHMSHSWSRKSCIEHRTTYHMSFIEHMDKKLYSCANCNYLKMVLVKIKLQIEQSTNGHLHVYDSSSNFKSKSTCTCKYTFVVACVVRSWFANCQHRCLKLNLSAQIGDKVLIEFW